MSVFREDDGAAGTDRPVVFFRDDGVPVVFFRDDGVPRPVMAIFRDDRVPVVVPLVFRDVGVLCPVIWVSVFRDDDGAAVFFRDDRVPAVVPLVFRDVGVLCPVISFSDEDGVPGPAITVFRGVPGAAFFGGAFFCCDDRVPAVIP